MKKIILGTITLIFILVILAYAGIQAMSSWYDTHEVIFNKMVDIKINRPFEVKTRIPEVKEIVLEYPDEIDTLIEKYICDTFGLYQCINALAIAKAESGMREDAININTNNTIDIGIFQINSVHFKKEGCSPKELLDQYTNVDCAFKIYTQQGNWSAWSAFNNNSFKNHIQ
jgi:hypothetical protein